MLSILWGVIGGLFLISLHQQTPRKRQIRERRRAELQRQADLKQLARDCEELHYNALMEFPELKYRQDLCWIEWHAKLANPEVNDPGARIILSVKDIENDPSGRSFYGDSYLRKIRRLTRDL